MRCLVISPTPSHPGNAGNRQRIQALLRRLKGFGHEVHLCFVMREAVEEQDLAAMRSAWDSLTTLPYDRRQERRSKGSHYGIDDWFPAPVEEAIRAIAEARSYDMVLVEYVFLSKALELFPAGTLKVIDTHDVFANRDRRLRDIGLEPAFFWTSPEEEGRGLDRADIVLAIQDEERRELEERTRALVLTLGHVPEVLAPPPRPEAATGPAVIGYLGSANPINQSALKALFGALDMPALSASGARLLVGGGASRAAADAPPPVEAVGEVARLSAFYAGIDLAVNPHQGGTGLKIKTVEALAHGRPILGTADAFLGLEPEAPFHAAPNATALAPQLLRYAREPAFRAEVAGASRALYARYVATVERQAAILRDAATLRGLLRRPRALLVTDLPFWQESLGNHVRITEMLRVGRQVMDFDVFVLRSLSPAERAAAQRVAGGRSRVFSFKDYPAGVTPMPCWIETQGVMQPYERTQFARAFFGALEAHLAKHSYAMGIIEYIRLSYLRHVRGFPPASVLDTHDVMSLRALNFAHFGHEHHIRIEVQDELRILDGFNLLLAIQAAEHRFLSSSLPGKSLYLPHSQPAVPRIDTARPARRVVFVGGDSPMNRDGLRWFLEQVWPCFEGREATLHVAGGVCETVRDLAPRTAQLVLHGQVPDLTAFLSAADIGINPVFYGGGLKIKTVEYLCRGIPSVLTEEAVFGIEGGAGTAFLLARSRLDYVAALDRLLRDAPLRERLSLAAHAFGRQQFGRAVSRRALQAMADFARGAVRQAPQAAA
ncbi:glycosyltransferase [Roseomonas sp. GC11]|uniref:glycosyltransferase n=1 Tax=Roseomonas sp. GC11 TaxID=2950546 RepID=UPI00210B38B8|nr:glycosyltransferase [Roseomonas sp. GC11]MCQ4159695.1 glycosyltransferase [Roseomonas sp. GC11]